MSDSSHFGFGKFVPGFDFLQSLAKGASSGIPQMPQLSNWVAPTLSVEELEKRIDELKAVQFWLEQNSRALTATIQALEVQKMTLATLQGMNMSMGDVANAFKFQGADSVMQGMQKAAETFSGAARAAAASPVPQAAAPAPVPPAPPPPAAPSPAAEAASADSEPDAPKPGVVDPLHWWSALTTQFQEIASNALKDAAQHSSSLDSTQHFAKDALKKATDMASHLAAQGVHSLQEAARAAQAPAAKKAAAKKPTAPKAAAKPTRRAAAAAPKAAAKKPAAKKPAAAKKAARGRG
ncbi:PhaM family polyhydroxyalkanoate granule multifunctional regulatory protein [Acidovorax sp. 106]|uniref:PhaM family polyhydroxyalkanoate granule multifunctional regulatory protein n=1 Tax=Acidovorax sp. 106 TaxID=2135637 RepID=UPI000EB0B7B8|nr:PhaM family polyhydroxyalkanoate granule multifunctional regulatory protein [Acidovorax sp. 106]RLJ37360.1 hypothetical protein C8C98_1070 [Acidovorax sp. 106]